MTSIPDIFGTMAYGPAPEAVGPAQAWLEQHGRRFGLFVGGAWTPAGAETFDTLNPATGKPLARLTQATAADVDRAVRAARGAQPGWWDLGGHGRARYLYAIARQVQKHSRLFAVLETLDNGKPIRESRDIDIPLVARHFYYHAGWAQLMARELPGREPVGVIGQIIPWNFPLLMLAWKIAPALAMGNTVVLKPAEFTSLTALRFAELCQEIGLPPGVVNIVTGDGRAGEAIVAHPGVDKIAFTGSTEVGRLIRAATAGSGKKLSLELGGKSPFVVFPDADLDSVVEGVVDAIWFNQGQVCCAGSRILVQEGAAERLVAKLKARMETLRVGDPLDKAVDMGAIIAPVQLEKIQSLVRRGQEEGAELWQPSWSCPREGWFFPPTLFTEVAPAATIAQVEIFGPVVVLMTFRTPAEAVELANNTRYGLAASLWTENINLALDVAPQLKAGTVWINCTNLFDAASGFGGYRESGFGREGGSEGLREYVKWADGRAIGRSGGRAVAGSKTRARRKSVRAASVATPAASDRPTDRLPAIDRTPKLYIGGKQARPRLRLQPAGARCRWAADRRGRARKPEGHPERGRSRAKGDELGTGHRAQPGAGAVLPRREPGGPRRVNSPAGSPQLGGDASVAAARGGAVDRADLHLRGVGRQVRRPGSPHALPERHARHAGADRGARRGLPGRGGRSSASSPPCCRPSRWATPSWRCRPRVLRSSPPISTRCWTRRTCRAA